MDLILFSLLIILICWPIQFLWELLKPRHRTYPKRKRQ